jgi:predicted anti-sigma-YlaC factor YlaD
MMQCDEVRDLLALDVDDDTPDLRAHLASCSGCAAYARSQASLDVILRTEMRWEAPANLTAQLLALAEQGTLATIVKPEAPRPLPFRRPQGWYLTLVYVLTFGAIILSMGVAWQFVGMLIGDISLQDAFAQLLAAPSRGLAMLTSHLPQSRPAIDFFLRVHEQLLWLLLAAVLWAALDKWNPQVSFGRRQQA